MNNSELVIYSNPKSSISESIRTLRTNLQFASVDKKIKTILITSSVPSEGKSFIAANLAASFADSGSNVLLVDCDIRKGRQHSIFNLHNKKGLSNLLLKDIKENYKSYIYDSGIKNLSLIFKGSTPPNPSELLNSEKNKQLISLLKEEYDIIIFDSAPLNGLPDSLIMSNLVDGVIITTRAKSTSFALLSETKKSLENINANILGVVLNKTDSKKNTYYDAYYGYYGN